jgi:hypothetical protein
MPLTDLQKIRFYFEEGKRLWAAMPEKVASREFYELWENIQQPSPFRVDAASLELMGGVFELPAAESPRMGCFGWDVGNGCAALTVECSEWLKKYLLFFSDGEPFISEEPVEFAADDELKHGEKLEVIYDLAAHLRKNHPGCDIAKLKKKDFVEYLGEIAADYDSRIINSMKLMSVGFMRNLFQQALSDQASDEVDRQLSLPLDGDYAQEADEDFNPAFTVRNLCGSIPAQTRWQVRRNLQFLSDACRTAAENEREFLLVFKDAESLGKPAGHELGIRLKIDPGTPVSEGDILNVYIRGERDIFGTFRIDIFDGDVIFGRLRCDDADHFSERRPQMFGRLQRSPRTFISNLADNLCRAIGEEQPQELGALDHVLGLKDLPFDFSLQPELPQDMDASQRQAWCTAVNPANPLVLIQGPPGTGKTHVLEQVVRHLCRKNLRILVAAPSNTAVDNICRRIADLPVLRFGKTTYSMAPDVAEKCWIGESANVARFVDLRRSRGIGGIYAGTHIGLLKDNIVVEDMLRNGRYDVIIFDEAGMSNLEEFLLCVKLGNRAVLFGDHQQLPPFPLPQNVIERLHAECGPVTREQNYMITRSALEWLIEGRNCPVIMLQRSYRCQNPRLLRFASTLFYDAGVRPSRRAEYYQLSFHERKLKYPPRTLLFYSTSALPPELRSECLSLEGSKPGLSNHTEAVICCLAFYRALQRYDIDEITIIAPYRKQVKLIRRLISLEKAREVIPEKEISDKTWMHFLSSRIATVDSFQGGESDIVIICYVRSNENGGIGFIDNPNRINVAHTRCRREINIVGDLDCLKRQARNNIFVRMERAFRRDGEVLQVTENMLPEATPEATPEPACES